MKHVYKRLQGKEWHSMKNDLELLRLKDTKNGHVKGFYKDVEGRVYSHWLNDDEICEIFNKYTLNQLRQKFGLKPVNRTKIFVEEAHDEC